VRPDFVNERNLDYLSLTCLLSSMRDGLKAQDRLQAFMRAQVGQRKQDLASGASKSARSSIGKDAFTMLVEASENEENAKLRLDDDELVRYMFPIPCVQTSSSVNLHLDWQRVHHALRWA